VNAGARQPAPTPSLFAEGERGGLGRGAGAFAPDSAVAVALRLLTSPAVKRAEHRSGTGGEEAHVSERSELCAVPPAREERRGPMRRSRIGSRPAVLSLGHVSLHEQRGAFSTAEWLVKVARSCGAGVKALLSCPCFYSRRCFSSSWKKINDKSFRSPLGERATFLCSCKEKVAKRKHALPPRPTRYARRVHSAAGIFRHDIPVVSKNDVHPCTSPLAGSCPSAPSLQKGTRKVKSQRAKAKSHATATATTGALLHLIPNLQSPTGAMQ